MTDKKRSVVTNLSFHTGFDAAAPVTSQFGGQLMPVLAFVKPAIPLAAGYATAQEKIDEISKWPAGWDGEDARKISEEAVARARAALQILAWQLPVPEITPNSNGTVSLEWGTPHGAANIEIGRTRFAGYVSSQGYPTQYFDETNQAVGQGLAMIVYAWLYGSRSPVKPVTSIEVLPSV